MECPKCGFENIDDSKFCLECGRKIETICPNCGKKLPSGAKFCNECGRNLRTPPGTNSKNLSFDEKIDKIQRYLPKGLTEKILSQRDRIEGERKQVTVMFCDMEGFTPLVAYLGSEGAYNIMDDVYEILIHKVHKYGGTVNEMTGDGIMALFGAPVAMEDAPQRAIRSAHAIHREMARFNERKRRKRVGIPPLKMRIGIHTGPVVVGTLGNDLRVEFKAVGDTVNLASRMEGLAAPRTTYVTGETFKLTEGFFRFEALGKLVIKGREDAVKAYRVIAPSTSRSRFDVNAERGLTQFVGRKRELEHLLEGFERSKAGRGRAVSIVAEAGVGKSRLLYEFRKTITAEDVTFIEGRCLSYGRNMTYHPIIDILRSTFHIENNSEREIRQKVADSLSSLGEGETSALPYFLELMSVKNSGMDQISMSPEGKKAQIIKSFNRLLSKGSEIRPLIIVVEDLHWTDKSSEDVLRNLLTIIPGIRVLVILTYRTSYSPPWGGKSYLSQVTLNRLNDRDSLVMARHMIGVDELPVDVQEQLLEKAEGIPFYIEELIKSLGGRDAGLRKDVIRSIPVEEVGDVPSTIQDIIMSRVDHLPERARKSLQTGAVIEREFDYRLLRRIVDISDQDLLYDMTILKDAELIYERGIPPESTYVFKHALTREVIYNSILSKNRKVLHEKIGYAIEAVYKQSIVDYYGILVEHFLQSQNYEKGAEYAKTACKTAQKRSAFIDAIAYAKKRIYCLDKLPQTDDIQKKLVDARTGLSMYYLNLNFNADAREIVDPIVDFAEEKNYTKGLSRIYTATGSYRLHIEENPAGAIEDLKTAIDFSQKAIDVIALWFGWFNMGAAFSVECDFRKGENYYAKLLELSNEAGNSVGISAAKSALSWYNYNFQGKLKQSLDLGRDSLRLGKKNNDIFIQAVAHSAYGATLYFKGNLDEAEKHLMEAVDLCRSNSIFAWGSGSALFLRQLYYEKHEYKKAINCFDEKTIKLLPVKALYPSLMMFAKSSACKSKLMLGDTDIDLDRLFSDANQNKLKFMDGWFSRTIAEILMMIDGRDQSEVEYWIRKSIDFDEKRKLKWQLAMDLSVYSDYLRELGKIDGAKAHLQKAIDFFKTCGADGWQQKTEKTMAVLGERS